MACILSKAPIFYRAAFHKTIIFGSVTQVNRRLYNQHLTNKTNAFMERKFRFKDNISNDYKLVYREQKIVNGIMIIGHTAGWIGAIYGMCLMGLEFLMDPPMDKGVEFEGGGILMSLSKPKKILLLLCCIGICTTLILCSRIIPFRIYHSATEKLYKAVFVPSISFKKQIVTFGEFTAVPIFKRRHAGDILFKINGRIVLLDIECFPVPFMRERMIIKST
ncbi:uncharacterized protein LOC114931962 [Nylanderia fulva]|uniref:uncharacterized protein LOC114931962 n=1 Tax=Nylanderia fulva TaxID=613905 RepID=UPI0010FB1F48|nr:uncharacterized protein LOC114931962 [Nylanderia fulva]